VSGLRDDLGEVMPNQNYFVCPRCGSVLDFDPQPSGFYTPHDPECVSISHDPTKDCTCDVSAEPSPGFNQIVNALADAEAEALRMLHAANWREGLAAIALLQEKVAAMKETRNAPHDLGPSTR
jgi:hypothetical protein